MKSKRKVLVGAMTSIFGLSLVPAAYSADLMPKAANQSKLQHLDLQLKQTTEPRKWMANHTHAFDSHRRSS